MSENQVIVIFDRHKNYIWPGRMLKFGMLRRLDMINLFFLGSRSYLYQVCPKIPKILDFSVFGSGPDTKWEVPGSVTGLLLDSLDRICIIFMKNKKFKNSF